MLTEVCNKLIKQLSNAVRKIVATSSSMYLRKRDIHLIPNSKNPFVTEAKILSGNSKLTARLTCTGGRDASKQEIYFTTITIFKWMD
jgi:hypothetical protein